VGYSQVGQAMVKDFDFTEEVRGLQVPTLIVAADADMAPPSHYGGHPRLPRRAAELNHPPERTVGRSAGHG
jgi:pimeloyl-ACP methyl ester carboxylesterase